jgi:hypothetical protein
LPWAIILLPFQGAGRANQAAPGNGAIRTRFHAGRLGRAVPEPQR